MKKLYRFLFIGLLALSLLPMSNAYAAKKMKKVVWKSYKLTFNIPAKWKVLKNSKNVFKAKGKNINMRIYAFKKNKAKQLKTAKKVAKASVVYVNVKSRKVKKSKSLRTKNGWKKHALAGKGKFKSRKASFYVVGLKNKKYKRPVRVQFIWLNKKGTKKYRKIVTKVANSIR